MCLNDLCRLLWNEESQPYETLIVVKARHKFRRLIFRHKMFKIIDMNMNRQISIWNTKNVSLKNLNSFGPYCTCKQYIMNTCICIDFITENNCSLNFKQPDLLQYYRGKDDRGRNQTRTLRAHIFCITEKRILSRGKTTCGNRICMF